MRKLFLLVSALSFVVLLVGCPKKKTEDADAAADATAAAPPPEDAAPAPAAAPAAKNANDVARFAAETAVADDDAKIASFAFARTQPKGGNNVAQVKPGMDVTKIAEYQEAILVTFADPKDANTTLMGWVDKSAFSVSLVKRDGGAKDAAVVDAAPAPLTCAAGQVAVVLAKDPVCKKKCTKDADCKNPPCATAQAANGKAARVCSQDP
jgi:hypothetical protein